MKLDAAKKRIQYVDTLRGFALLGMLLTHTRTWFVLSIIPETVMQKYNHDTASILVGMFNSFFIVGKFYTIFSFLFGVSFGIQLSEKVLADNKFIPMFVWRLVLLFIIGLIHHLHWNGDVLGVYAFLGLFLILFRKATNRYLIIGGLFLSLILPSFIHELAPLFEDEPKSIMGNNTMLGNVHINDDYLKSFETLKRGSYTEIILQNANGLKSKLDYQWNTSRVFVTFGLMLFGFLVGRGGYLKNLLSFRPYATKIMFGAMLMVGVCYWLLKTMSFEQSVEGWNVIPTIVHNFLMLLKALLTTIVYISALFYLLNLKQMEFVADSLAIVGKMAMTNYLMQSLIGVLLFYSIGLGWAGDISPAWCYLIAILVFVFQVMYSKWWLSKYNYGPMEWLWRSATYMSWQTLRISSPKNITKSVVAK
ncbi:DUF418 domain-containing protein [Arcicella aquatica]|uniref:DUF418 domain-containing protein n=1 Tax=Arcicella aquatica TaxID=217141 RepID=A0ABU5QSE1_9BACT|nr:DUF418 domain-containing protein [Arcicella aquatica]MEA5260017.1 DUF418 domain-containing protein [Arcicella aquatica]